MRFDLRADKRNRAGAYACEVAGHLGRAWVVTKECAKPGHQARGANDQRGQTQYPPKHH